MVAVAPLIANLLLETAYATSTQGGALNPLALNVAAGATEEKILMEALAPGNGSLGSLWSGALIPAALAGNGRPADRPGTPGSSGIIARIPPWTSGGTRAN